MYIRKCSLPEDCDDNEADMRGSLELEHLVEHTLVLVFTDYALYRLQKHVEEYDE
jgi:hypothetical protein